MTAKFIYRDYKINRFLNIKQKVQKYDRFIEIIKSLELHLIKTNYGHVIDYIETTIINDSLLLYKEIDNSLTINQLNFLNLTKKLKLSDESNLCIELLMLVLDNEFDHHNLEIKNLYVSDLF